MKKTMRHISDSERLTLAQLNRKETENKQLKEKLCNAYKQLRVMSDHIAELKGSNKLLAQQIRVLVSMKREW